MVASVEKEYVAELIKKNIRYRTLIAPLTQLLNGVLSVFFLFFKKEKWSNYREFGA